MHRRKVLKQLALAIPAGITISSLLEACSKTSPIFDNEVNDKVTDPLAARKAIIIIGAGAAGIYTAYLLNNAGYNNIIILEAASIHGGRIRKLTDFADFPIELGAEEVHGRNSTWADIVIGEGGKLVNDNGTEDYYWLDNKYQAYSNIKTDADLIAVNRIANNLDSRPPSFFPDVDAASYILSQNISSRTVHVSDANVGGEYGTTNERLGVKPVAEGNQLWTSGDTNFVCSNKAYIDILNSKCSSILGKIKYNTQVKSIDYSGSTIIVKDQLNKSYTADRVIVTVPLTILRDGDIKFNPSLPANKISSINKLNMGAGMKIILKFNKQLWANNLGSIYSNGSGIVPEFWATGWKKTSNNVVLTAYIMGAFAEQLSSQGTGAVKTVLEQLDLIWGNKKASTNFVSSYIIDWYKDPFIKGAYSFPKPGSSNADRIVLSQKINNKIFFAGEATNLNGMYATVHGAIESAERVSTEVKNSF